MKKFEIVVKNPEYDYITKRILTDELQSVFPRMIFEVKTIPQRKIPYRKPEIIRMKEKRSS